MGFVDKLASKAKKLTGQVDWSDPEAFISKHFKVKEALYLPSWDVLHQPSAKEKRSILKMARKMDVLREFLGRPIIVHVWIRPVLHNPSDPNHGRDYNRYVYKEYVWKPQGYSNSQMDGFEAPDSAHRYGIAVDWHPSGLSVGDAKELILDHELLERENIRMENNPGGSWIHNDLRKPGVSGRFFNL